MKTVNNFQISGFVVNNATINQFATATIARFGLSVRRTEKNGDEKKGICYPQYRGMEEQRSSRRFQPPHERKAHHGRGLLQARGMDR